MLDGIDKNIPRGVITPQMSVFRSHGLLPELDPLATAQTTRPVRRHDAAQQRLC
jgi:hypothetical protein